METCVRGFSFMPENGIELAELQYIEGGELERTWKANRRERLKQQEQRIWEEFVKEQDVLDTVCKDDPYQFLEQLPESCLKELMETELQKMRKEVIEEVAPEQIEHEVEILPAVEESNQHTVTFVEGADKDDDMFHIFDDDKEDEQSGAEDEVLNESLGSPETVRERELETSPPSVSISPDKGKSSENVTSMIESSIYCAKVKDLRMKINEELLAIMSSLDRVDVVNMEPEVLSKTCKRASEFCTRFNRIYMYQLQRQIQDVKRNNSLSLPFAKHTHFQSQMVRIVSLHHNLLQSYQIFHKSVEQTGCVGESAEVVRSLTSSGRAASDTCRGGLYPPDLTAARNLYDDELIITFDKLDEAVKDHTTRVNKYLEAIENSNSQSKKSVKGKGKKKSTGMWSKSGTRSVSETEARLSMYSLDTLRINLNTKPSSSKDNQSSSGTYKLRGANTASSRGNNQPADSKRDPIKSHRKSPRSRRPLMRAPHGSGPGVARSRPHKDAEIRTMVEAVDTCTSSHISREVSPNPPKQKGSPRRKAATPRAPTPHDAPRALPPATPQLTPRAYAPSVKSLHTVTQDLSPVSKIQCSKKEREDKLETDGEESKEEKRVEKEKSKVSSTEPARCEVSRLIRQLCGGDAAGSRSERSLGAKNAQLLCINGGSPRQPSTPQLLRILEETIQKKAPKPLFPSPAPSKDPERYRLTFNIAEKTAENLFQYRTKFVQHMLTSAMYANSAIGKPWEVISSISEQMIDELLFGCAKEMELKEIVNELYKCETS